MMDFLKQPVFEVGDIDENIDLSLPPSSGEEYIKRVVIEAQQCADVVVADLHPSFVKPPTKSYYEPLAGCIQAPPSLRPTLEWQQCQISDFSNVRLYVSQLKDEIQTSKRKWKPPDVDLPDIDDSNAWIKLCTDKNKMLEPTLNTLFCFSQAIVEQLLEYLTEFVETERRIEYKIGQWIYALLVILEQPLFPDTCSTLRSLARACSVIRAESVMSIIALQLNTNSVSICWIQMLSVLGKERLHEYNHLSILNPISILVLLISKYQKQRKVQLDPSQISIFTF